MEVGPFQHYEDSLSATLAAIMSASLIYSYQQTEGAPTFEEHKENMLLEFADYMNRHSTVGES